MRTLSILVVATAFLTGGAAQAAQLLTDGTGYAGPVINMGTYPDPGFIFTNAPQQFGDITVSGDNIFETTVYGKPFYGFGINGASVGASIIATGSSDSSLFIDFASPVALFGAGLNYAPGLDPNSFPFPVVLPSISAFDSDGNLIASYDLEALAPIRTGGEIDTFAFRGIDGEGRLISRFVVTGSYSGILISDGVLMDPDPHDVPAPASWATVLVALAGIGGMARLQRQRTA